jgi:peptide/nickel transport system substrate-binding protein
LAWVLGAAMAAAGCGSQGAGAGGAYRDSIPLLPDTMRFAVQEPGVYGGRFVFAETGGPKTFNAMIANETSTTDITNLLFSNLSDFDNHEQTETPMLAYAPEVSADGLTWSYRLRRGACFSDGHPLTSEDVMFSLDVAYDPVVHPSVAELLQSAGKPFEYSAPDSYTVVFKIAAPYALMNAAVGSVRIMPKHKLYDAWKAGNFESSFGVKTPPDELVTSGAWRLKEYVENEKVVLTRNPYWLGVDSRGRRLPYLDELVFVVVPNQNTAALKFQAGEVDALDNTKPDDYKTFKDGEARGRYKVYDLGPALSTNFFWFNLNLKKDRKTPYVERWKYEIFRNPEFRRAVSQAVDRDAMIRGPFFSRAVKNWATTTSGNKVWHDEGVTAFDYDPEAAKKRLSGMGLRDGDGDGYLEDAGGHTVSFTLSTNAENNVRVELCNMIAEDLKKVGIKVILAPVEFNTLITRIREDKGYESILLGLQTGVPPDPSMGQNVYRSSGKTHYWNLEQPKPETPEEARIDRLMDALSGTNDLAERKAAWLEVKNIVNDQCWFIWLPTLLHYNMVSDKFGNVQPSAIPHRVLWNIDRVYRKPGA